MGLLSHHGLELCCPDGGKEVLINKVFGLLALQKHGGDKNE